MDLTVVVPTRNEAPNVHNLVVELSRNVPPRTCLIFVDDSDDNLTVLAMQAAQRHWPVLQIKIIHRPPGERENGLAGAVTRGIRLAESELVLVMDGDLQHPPSTIPAMLEAVSQVDTVIASRYCRGGSAGGLNSPLRHAVSRLSTWSAKGLFPYALRGVTDPMTGFFLIRRESIDPAKLQAAGFKILLEVLVRHPHLRRSQVPLQFAARGGGVSKGTVTQGMHYLRQLIRLRFAPTPSSPTSSS